MKNLIFTFFHTRSFFFVRLPSTSEIEHGLAHTSTTDACMRKPARENKRASAPERDVPESRSCCLVLLELTDDVDDHVKHRKAMFFLFWSLPNPDAQTAQHDSGPHWEVPLETLLEHVQIETAVWCGGLARAKCARRVDSSRLDRGRQQRVWRTATGKGVQCIYYSVKIGRRIIPPTWGPELRESPHAERAVCARVGGCEKHRPY